MSIYKLAKETGFSSSTVARALSGNGYCDPKTKKVISEAALRLNYRPNLSARALRSNRTERILFCIPDICNPFYFRMIQGASAILEEHNYYAMLVNTEHSLEREIKMIDLLTQKYCDGMIMVSFDFNETNIEAIRCSGAPTVITNRYLNQRADDNFDYIYVDHIRGMEIAARHLIERGCRNIVLITGDLNEQTSRERVQGYLKALSESGISYDETKVLNGYYSMEKSYEVFARFLASGKALDGVIAANDLSGYGVLRACNEHNIVIPRDIKLVSFDNTDYALIANPTFTSVDMKQYEIGQQAARVLLERIHERREVANVNIVPELIVRESSC